MKRLIFRLFFIIIFWGFLFVYAFPWSSYNIEMPFTWKDYRLGLDLSWWIELDYKVDLEEAKKEEDYDIQRERDIIEWLKSIIDRRVESLNINDSVITSADYAWEKHIIVQIPMKWNDILENSENIKRAKEAIWKVVKIEFKEERRVVTDDDVIERKKIADNALLDSKENTYSFHVVSQKYKDNYENIETWTLTWTIDEFSKFFNLWNVELNVWLVPEVLTWTWKDVYSILSWNMNVESWDRWYYILNIDDLFEQRWLEISYIFVSEKPSEWKSAMDSEGRILNDKYFVKSSVQYDEAFTPLVELTFNDEGAKIFWELTKRLVWERIAIFVWGQNLTAPVVNQPILNWKAVITWNRSVEEAKKLVQDINLWVVPAPIYLTSEKTIDSKLWASSLEKLVKAWVFWFLIIFIFLIVAYRASWFLASVSLFVYVMLILTIVKSFWTVLTLASVAWLILSIWMAIDANILIFERVKDELKSGKNLKDSVEIWFKKSWSAIWDSNVTWFIVAMILYIFWINLIKWFWLMLALWIIVSLFSVYFISRVLISLLSNSCKKQKIFIWK